MRSRIASSMAVWRSFRCCKSLRSRRSRFPGNLPTTMAEQSPAHNESTGILLAGRRLLRSGAWCRSTGGLLGDVPPFELTVHRILWCALFVGDCGSLARGARCRIAQHLCVSRALLATLGADQRADQRATGRSIIYCVATHQLVEASLGYYLTPLVSIALGVSCSASTCRACGSSAIALARRAVGDAGVRAGTYPVDRAGAGAVVRLLRLFPQVTAGRFAGRVDGRDADPVSVRLRPGGILVVCGTRAAFPSADLGTRCAVDRGGPLTAVPLAMFAAGARRIRLTTLGLPAISLAVDHAAARDIRFARAIHARQTRSRSAASGRAIVIVSLDRLVLAGCKPHRTPERLTIASMASSGDVTMREELLHTGTREVLRARRVIEQRHQRIEKPAVIEQHDGLVKLT